MEICSCVHSVRRQTKDKQSKSPVFLRKPIYTHSSIRAFLKKIEIDTAIYCNSCTLSVYKTMSTKYEVTMDAKGNVTSMEKTSSSPSVLDSVKKVGSKILDFSSGKKGEVTVGPAPSKTASKVNEEFTLRDAKGDYQTYKVGPKGGWKIRNGNGNFTSCPNPTSSSSTPTKAPKADKAKTVSANTKAKSVAATGDPFEHEGKMYKVGPRGGWQVLNGKGNYTSCNNPNLSTSSSQPVKATAKPAAKPTAKPTASADAKKMCVGPKGSDGEYEGCPRGLPVAQGRRLYCGHCCKK